jgi:hypothetical protein
VDAPLAQASARDPQAFAACQQQLAALHQAETRREVAVYYTDEVRFSR